MVFSETTRKKYKVKPWCRPDTVGRGKGDGEGGVVAYRLSFPLTYIYYSVTLITKYGYIKEVHSITDKVFVLTFPLHLLFLQVLASKMDDQLLSLRRLNELSEKLVSSSNNQEFAQEVHALTERVQDTLPIVGDWSSRLTIMLQCFEHQQCTQKHVTFLEEVNSRLEVEFCLDGVVDVENELEVVKVRKGLESYVMACTS